MACLLGRCDRLGLGGGGHLLKPIPVLKDHGGVRNDLILRVVPYHGRLAKSVGLIIFRHRSTCRGLCRLFGAEKLNRGKIHVISGTAITVDDIKAPAVDPALPVFPGRQVKNVVVPLTVGDDTVRISTGLGGTVDAARTEIEGHAVILIIRTCPRQHHHVFVVVGTQADIVIGHQAAGIEVGKGIVGLLDDLYAKQLKNKYTLDV